MAKSSYKPPKSRVDKLRQAFRVRPKPEDASTLEAMVRIMRKKKNG